MTLPTATLLCGEKGRHDALRRALASVRTRSFRRSARAGWARSTARATRGSGARSPSRSCRPRSPTDPERLRALRARGAIRLGVEPSEHRRDLRRRRIVRRSSSRSSSWRARRCAKSSPRARCRSTRLLAISAQVADGLSQARTRRDRAPRPEAREHHGDAGRLREDPRLRPREADVQPEASSGSHERRRRSRAAPSPGLVMGTAAYMSPEQARGKRVDFRSDQFSLGSILYEMATGGAPFPRASAPETLAAIIREEPEPLATRHRSTPRRFTGSWRGASAKSREERYASTSRPGSRPLDAQGSPLEASGVAATAVSHPGRRRYRGLVLAAVAAIALATASSRPLWDARSRPPTTNSKQLSFRRGMIWSGRFAPTVKP